MTNFTNLVAAKLHWKDNRCSKFFEIGIGAESGYEDETEDDNYRSSLKHRNNWQSTNHQYINILVKTKCSFCLTAYYTTNIQNYAIAAWRKKNSKLIDVLVFKKVQGSRWIWWLKNWFLILLWLTTVWMFGARCTSVL